ncbi:hypothetical protein OZX65_06300 [Leuconostocaceae bacterium ESL0723]|nr:hypothetical protein OZX65_06300 [Leuconostocaceae bacterium ESL0723]
MWEFFVTFVLVPVTIIGFFSIMICGPLMVSYAIFWVLTLPFRIFLRIMQTLTEGRRR